MKILVAEDNRFFRRLIEVNLKQWGHEIISCGDGAEAWEILKEEDRPHMAILDWEMPEMEGIEVCKAVRALKNRPYVYIILLTAKNRRDDLVIGLDSGADDYITKPFEPVEFQVRLRAGTRIVQLQEELLSAFRAAEVRSKEDSLTGLWNHAAIIEMLKNEMDRSSRRRRPLGVIMADVDNFKRINDSNGHMEGDRVLKRVAELMRANIRPYDFVGRYGGEEFLILLPECGEQHSIDLAERLRMAVESDLKPALRGDLKLTMSFGVTSAETLARDYWEEAVRAADKALYEAKGNGRNKVVFRPVAGPSFSVVPAVASAQ
jgi:two-component system, cell cycle response regulator